MNEESNAQIEPLGINQPELPPLPRRDYFSESRPVTLKRMLGAIPPRPEEEANEIGAHAAGEALKRSEARRDAVLAVALAIKRRGGNPMTDWTTKDVDTAYAIADQLIALAS